MYQTWWKVLWSSIYIVILAVNIAFTFNVVHIVNPTSLDIDYSQYYFGISSFIDSFKYWFGNNTLLQGFYGILQRLGQVISDVYTRLGDPIRLISGLANMSKPMYELLSMIFSLILFTQSIIPMLLMVIMGLFYLTYILIFLLQCALFVTSFMGGTFATPLPNVYPELQVPVS